VISTFDTDVLVYATGPKKDPKCSRARDRVGRGMRAGASVLLLQTLGEFSHVTIRKMAMSIGDVRPFIEAWRAVFPVHAAEGDDLLSALAVVETHRFAFWDAMLWATARRIGVRFVNPFDSANNAVVDAALPP
jgi:predicted nucleic acid-binding protein